MIKVSIYKDGASWEVKGDNVEEVITVLAEIIEPPHQQMDIPPQADMVIVCPACYNYNEKVDGDFYICKTCDTIYE